MEERRTEVDADICSFVPISGGDVEDLKFPELVMLPLIGARFVGEHVSLRFMRLGPPSTPSITKKTAITLASPQDPESMLLLDLLR
jgi:hypothetical protein